MNLLEMNLMNLTPGVHDPDALVGDARDNVAGELPREGGALHPLAEDHLADWLRRPVICCAISGNIISYFYCEIISNIISCFYTPIYKF